MKPILLLPFYNLGNGPSTRHALVLLPALKTPTPFHPIFLKDTRENQLYSSHSITWGTAPPLCMPRHFTGWDDGS